MTAPKVPIAELRKKYTRVRNDTEKGETAENDLLVSSTKFPAPYIRRALLLLNGPQPKKEGEEEKKDEEKKEEKKEDEEKAPTQTYRTITIMGRGKAVQTVVQIAEILKRRVKGLHQVSKLEITTVTDHWQPKDNEEGLEEVKLERAVAGLHITLSLDELDKNAYGYQEPLPEDQVVDEAEALLSRPKKSKAPKKQEKAPVGRGGGRGTPAAGGRGGGRGAPVGRGGGRGGGAAKGGRGKKN